MATTKTAKKTTKSKGTEKSAKKSKTKVTKLQAQKAKAASKTKVRLSREKARRASQVEKTEGKAKSTKKVKPIGHAPHSARITAPKGPVQPLAARTQFGGLNDPDRKWLVVDAAGQTVGRLASEIAMILRGKHKATFTPNNDQGDFVVVINAEKVVFKAAKEDEKRYYNYSGYIGGMKATSPAKLRKEYPERILFNAVRGMVPRSPLGRQQMRKLKIYSGSQHPHTAQLPVAWQLRHVKQGQ